MRMYSAIWKEVSPVHITAKPVGEARSEILTAKVFLVGTEPEMDVVAAGRSLLGRAVRNTGTGAAEEVSSPCLKGSGRRPGFRKRNIRFREAESSLPAKGASYAEGYRTGREKRLRRGTAGQAAWLKCQGRGARSCPDTEKSVPIISLRFPLLQKVGGTFRDSVRELKNTAAKLQQTLATFGVKVTITDISHGTVRNQV